ncbi:MAG: hypothetical protein WDM86_18370 [Rhizomicrobium sp.]
MTIAPVVEDFTGRFDLPASMAGCRKIGFFPDSTSGNLRARGLS